MTVNKAFKSIAIDLIINLFICTVALGLYLMPFVVSVYDDGNSCFWGQGMIKFLNLLLLGNCLFNIYKLSLIQTDEQYLIHAFKYKKFKIASFVLLFILLFFIQKWNVRHTPVVLDSCKNCSNEITVNCKPPQLQYDSIPIKKDTIANQIIVNNYLTILNKNNFDSLVLLFNKQLEEVRKQMFEEFRNVNNQIGLLKGDSTTILIINQENSLHAKKIKFKYKSKNKV